MKVTEYCTSYDGLHKAEAGMFVDFFFFLCPQLVLITSPRRQIQPCYITVIADEHIRWQIAQ